jgi:hypothetical protein
VQRDELRILTTPVNGETPEEESGVSAVRGEASRSGWAAGDAARYNTSFIRVSEGKALYESPSSNLFPTAFPYGRTLCAYLQPVLSQFVRKL